MTINTKNHYTVVNFKGEKVSVIISYVEYVHLLKFVLER